MQDIVDTIQLMDPGWDQEAYCADCHLVINDFHDHQIRFQEYQVEVYFLHLTLECWDSSHIQDRMRDSLAKNVSHDIRK